MKLGQWSKGIAVAAAATMALAACSAQGGIVENTSVTVAWNQPAYSFNTSTTTGNATANSNVLYLTQQSFNYYNADQELIQNKKFGTYEKISDDPLTVKYTVAKGVTWSDGVAVDAADLLLNWVALSGAKNNGEPAYDEETGVLIPGDNVWFDSVAIGGGIEQASQTPVIGDDGRSITIVYDKFLVDWELLFTSAGVPAHVVANHGLGIADPAEAKKAVIDAINNDDTDALKGLADFWSLGFDYTKMPTGDDADVTVGTGAYVVTDFTDQFISFKAREDFKAGDTPSVQNITIKFIPDATASVQALQNGEVTITQPQATTDVLDFVKQIDSAEIIQAGENTYEHLDLVFNNGGPFDPATYGGDEEKAKKVRQAFLKALNSQEIIDKLIKPLNEKAVWVQSQVYLPGQPGYDEAIKDNGAAGYGQGDIEGAKALLDEAGVDTPIDVTFLFSSTNTRRGEEYKLFKAQLKDAGFNLVDGSDENWGALLGSGSYDASLFAWQSTSTAVTANQPTFQSDGGNNFTGYANDKVDALYEELSGTTDEDRQKEILAEVDKYLWEDGYGMTLFQFPQITAYDGDLKGISSSPLAPTFFWEYWAWKAPVVK